MITDIEKNNRIGHELRIGKLESYRSDYFSYRDDALDLHRIIEEKLTS